MMRSPDGVDKPHLANDRAHLWQSPFCPTNLMRKGDHRLNAWMMLGLAIVAEVIGTTALKASENFTRLMPSLIVVVGYGVAFYCLSLVLKSIPVGVAYAIWSGLGIVLITLVAYLVYGQHIDLAGLIGMGLIIAGVVVLNVFSKSSVH
jgi:multidrug transporter EmrE-like cation transporter